MKQPEFRITRDSDGDFRVVRRAKRRWWHTCDQREMVGFAMDYTRAVQRVWFLCEPPIYFDESGKEIEYTPLT